MGFITKILAGLGHMKSMEKLHVDDHTEAIIKDIEHEPYAVSDTNVMYAGFNELGGYHFIQTIIVGQFHIKTIKGATLTFETENDTLTYNSDSLEFESDYSNVSNRSITKIDFQIEKEDLKKIKSKNVKTIILEVKKKRIEFTKYASDKK